jgi:tryptophan synthase beta subunit
LPSLPSGSLVIVNLSGRGDKDVDAVRGFIEARDHAKGGAA